MKLEIRRDYERDVVAYQHGLRRYLRDLDVAEHWRSGHFSSAKSVFEHDAERMLRLYTDGWSRFGWPDWAGGFGGTEEHRMAYLDELVRARIPVPEQHDSLEQFLPVLVDHAPDLAAAYLPRYLRGSEWWSTNLSEWQACDTSVHLPLSAAVDCQGQLTIDGAQAWSYVGPTPTRILIAASCRHPIQGAIATPILIDPDADGLAVRRRAGAGDRTDVVEISVDSVWGGAPVVVGAKESGLAIASRISAPLHGLRCYAGLSKVLFELNLLREAMTARGSSQGQRQRFARVYVDVVAAQALSSASIRAEAQGQPAPAEDYIEGMLLQRARERVSDLILDVGRPHMIRGTAEGGVALDSVRTEWWYARAAAPVRDRTNDTAMSERPTAAQQ